MNSTIRPAATVLMLALTTSGAQAQGLTSGTGMQPSTQVATPPDTPAIDRPGAGPTSTTEHAKGHSVIVSRPGQNSRAVDPPSKPSNGAGSAAPPATVSPPR